MIKKNLKLTDEENQKEFENMLRKLEEAGIEVKRGEKRPVNGKYSGIIGELGQGMLKININP